MSTCAAASQPSLKPPLPQTIIKKFLPVRKDLGCDCNISFGEGGCDLMYWPKPETSKHFLHLDAKSQIQWNHSLNNSSNLKMNIVLNVKRRMYLGANVGNFIPLIGNRELRDIVEMTSQPVYLFLSQLLCNAHSLNLAKNTAAAQRAEDREEPVLLFARNFC